MTGLAFLHVPKTGGTSVSDFLRPKYRSNERFVCENPAHFKERAEREGLPEPFISGHFHHRDAIRISPDRVYFTMLREPRSHLMSLIWHSICATGGTLNGRKHPSFDMNLFRERMVEVATIYTRHRHHFGLSHAESRETLKAFDIVGTTERAGDSLRVLCTRMNWAVPGEIGTARYSAAGDHEMPEEIADILAERIEMDLELYRIVEGRLADDLSRL